MTNWNKNIRGKTLFENAICTEKMTFTHVLCKIVVAQNINDKSGHYTFWKCHIEGAAWKKPLFRGAPRIQRMTFLQGIWVEIDKNKETGFEIMSI